MTISENIIYDFDDINSNDNLYYKTLSKINDDKKIIPIPKKIKYICDYLSNIEILRIN